MSIVVSFYVLSKSDFEHYLEMDDLLPHDPQRKVTMRIALPGNVQTQPRKLEDEQAELRKLSEIGKYLGDRSGPYDYKWSGAVLNTLLYYLKEFRRIDLTANRFDHKGPFSTFLLDRSIKNKYLAKLDPSDFSEIELASAYKQITEQRFGKERVSRGKMHFPEQGQAMLDGIKIIYDHLQLVDDELVVLLYLGY